MDEVVRQSSSAWQRLPVWLPDWVGRIIENQTGPGTTLSNCPTDFTKFV